MSEFKIIMPTTQEEWQRDCQIAYNKGRAYAIDKYNEKIKECCSIVGSCDFGDLDRIAKQLKEEKQ